jgi:hypothetical protein
MKGKAVWISCILAALFCGCAANARVIITLDQVGPNVVATGSGTIDFTDLTLLCANCSTAIEINPTSPLLVVGSPIQNIVSLRQTCMKLPDSICQPSAGYELSSLSTREL